MSDLPMIEVPLALHGESNDGKAWLLSRTGRKRDAVRVPKSSVEIGDACGGFQRFDDRAAVVLIPIHYMRLPQARAAEKGLIAA